MNKLNVHIVKYCIFFLSIYFAHVHLQRRVHFNFVFMHLQKEVVFVQVHFTSRWSTSLARGSEVHMGSSIRSRSMSSLESLEYNLQANFAATSFNLGDV